MRLHSIPAWPPAVFQPAQKTEAARPSKTAEKNLKAWAAQLQRVPPPPPPPRRDPDEDDRPGENFDIIA